MNHRPIPVIRTTRRLLLVAAAACVALAAPAQQPSSPGPVRAEVLARGLQQPWAMAFLPDFERERQLLVTERGGHLRIVTLDASGDPARARIGPPVAGVPPVAASGQGGLLDVALDPDFAANRRVYLSYAEPAAAAGTDDRRAAGTAVARGTLQGNALADVTVIFRQQPKAVGGNHFGARLVFARDGRLFVTLGDRFSLRDRAQTLDSHLGKTVRIEADGRVPADNPFVGKAGALPEIWSYGHRNMQGAAVHPATGELWTHEHGPQGGDEVNVDRSGRNYGWPAVTAGREYGSGQRIGEGTTRADVEPAVVTWVPSIAPSGMAFVTGERYPGWQGSLFVGALRGETLVRLELDGARVVREERLLTNRFERIRDVRQGPDGWLYLLTDNADGKLLRLVR